MAGVDNLRVSHGMLDSIHHTGLTHRKKRRIRHYDTHIANNFFESIQFVYRGSHFKLFDAPLLTTITLRARFCRERRVDCVKEAMNELRFKAEIYDGRSHLDPDE